MNSLEKVVAPYRNNYGRFLKEVVDKHACETSEYPLIAADGYTCL